MSGPEQLPVTVWNAAVGDPLPELVVVTDPISLFRFSATTWNAHRIHWDHLYSLTEGYEGLVVQSHLHGSYLARMVRQWAGPAGRLNRFSWQNRRYAVVGDVLTCTGRVVGVTRDNDMLTIDLELAEHNQRGELCAPGTATVTVPADGHM